ncbi:MAG: glycosyltransferase family 4 protein [Smithella sp.]|jgi:glycosyltransferase involved in cell wall biosynthesis
MKILMANKFFYVNGGSETVFFQEREFLVNRGYHVIDFSMQDERNFDSVYAGLFVDNINYESTEGFSRKLKTAASFIHSSEAVRKLEKLLKQERPDVAHLHNIYHQLTPAIIPVLKKAGVKVVLTLHDYKLLCPSYSMVSSGEICNRCKGRNFYQASLNKCQEGSWFKSFLLSAEAYWHKWVRSYDFVDLFLAPSEFMAEIMTKYRIEPAKMVVLHNGIDSSKYVSSDVDKEFILYFGRVSEEKGVETLIRAYKRSGTKMPLKIVGTGPDKERLQRQYPDVEFLGYKSGGELNNFISSASFCVVPSQWYENCSMTVLEAMAFGKPVIGSRIGGIPEQIDDGKSGLLFQMGNVDELENKMKILINDTSLRSSMGKAARAILEDKYSLSMHCDQLMRIYDDLLSTR